jgi:hypothetical protein
LSYLYPEIINAKFSIYDNNVTEYYESINALTKEEYINEIDHLAYKYLASLDGHTCSWMRVEWIMYSSSVLVKTETNKLEWFYYKIKPYEHYIPIKEDLSDIFE